jgi:hypothetical protein
MKLFKLLPALLMLFLAVSAQAQIDAISTYFEKYMDDEQFTTVYISGRMFKMFAQMADDEADDEIKEIAAGLEGLRILTTEENGAKYFKEIMGQLNTKDYEPLMTVREEGSDEVHFLIKEAGDTINELLLVVGGEDEFVLMSFVGNIDLAKISKLSGAMDIEGLEHLKKVEEEKSKENKQ